MPESSNADVGEPSPGGRKHISSELKKVFFGQVCYYKKATEQRMNPYETLQHELKRLRERKG
jgi:hypothetical protein